MPGVQVVKVQTKVKAGPRSAGCPTCQVLSPARSGRRAVRTRPLLRALAETVAALLGERRLEVTIPELERIDLSSLSAIRWLLRATGGRLTFRIGHDPSVTPSSPLDRTLRGLKLRELKL